MKRLVVLLSALFLAIAACSGTGEQSTSAPSATASTSATPVGTVSSPTPPPEEKTEPPPPPPTITDVTTSALPTPEPATTIDMSEGAGLWGVWLGVGPEGFPVLVYPSGNRVGMGSTSIRMVVCSLQPLHGVRLPALRSTIRLFQIQPPALYPPVSDIPVLHE